MKNKKLILIIIVFTVIFLVSLLFEIKPVNAGGACQDYPEGWNCSFGGSLGRWYANTDNWCNPPGCSYSCSGNDRIGHGYAQMWWFFCFDFHCSQTVDHCTDRDYVGPWDEFCKPGGSGENDNADRWRKRWREDGYCSGGACQVNGYGEEEFVQDCGNSSWSNNYQCSGNTRQRWYTRRGCYDSGTWTGCYTNDFDRGYWADVQDCGSTTYGSWSYYCSGSSRYRRRTVYNRGCSGSGCFYYTSTQNEYVESCGGDYWTNEYRCSGNTRQRKYVNRGCSGSSCYANSEWKNVQNCGSTTYGDWSFYCSGDNVYKRRTVYNRGCSGSSCYYYTTTQTEYVQNCASTAWTYYCSSNDLWRQRTVGSCSSGACQGSTQNEFYQDCGEDYCEAWGSNYCKDNDVYRQSTCYDKGCSGTSCFDNTYQDEEKVQECGSGYWSDEYQCQGNWSQRKWINQGCSGNSCSESSEWRNYRDCTATCYPGVLGEGCAGGAYTCNVSSGKCDFPLQACSPPQYESQGTVCECNDVIGTIVRACDGSGSCFGVGEKCDTACGADPECQGLEPGDLYPGDPLKRCCKGQAGLPTWREVAPY